MAGPYTLINTARAPSTSLPVAHLDANTNYCFEVSSDGGGGPGPLSSPGCTSTESLPPAPTSIVATQQSPTSVEVQWNPVAGATKYYLYNASAVGGPYSYYTTIVSPYTSFVDSGLTAGGTDCYTVQAQTSAGMSPQTSGTCNTSLQPPTNITAAGNGTGRMNIKWTIAANATKTYVFESANGGAYALRCSVLSTAAQTCARAGLTSGTQYCYELQSQGSTTNNQSSLSVPIVCATAP
jgi:hypothetical protein